MNIEIHVKNITDRLTASHTTSLVCSKTTDTLINLAPLACIGTVCGGVEFNETSPEAMAYSSWFRWLHNQTSFPGHQLPVLLVNLYLLPG